MLPNSPSFFARRIAFRSPDNGVGCCLNVILHVLVSIESGITKGKAKGMVEVVRVQVVAC